MNQLTSQLAPIAILGAGVLLVSGVREQYIVPSAAPMAAISSTISGQAGRDMVVPEDERRIAGMTDYMLRSFGPDTAPTFTVYVGYYDRQVQGKTIHSPKNCLPGAGWEVMQSTHVAFPGAAGGTINRVVLANGGAQALVYYWYQGRGRVESSEYRVKWDLLRDAARYGRTEEALVRIVVPITTKTGEDPNSAAVMDLASADKVATGVATELLPAVNRVMPAFP